MILYYNDVDISDNIEVVNDNLTLCSGGYFDSIKVAVNNTENEWSDWNPKKHDTIKINEGNISSGIMYIDIIEQHDSIIILKALPVKDMAKEIHTKSWENITLYELFNEFALFHGLKLKTYDVKNYTYNRVNQIQMTDFEFLRQRCILEGYTIKIHDNTLIIYNENKINTNTAITITKDDLIGNFTYQTHTPKKEILLKYGDISFNYYHPTIKHGSIMKVGNIHVNSIAEAQRYSMNLLYNANKNNDTLSFDIKIRDDLAAGSHICFKGAGMADGNYFVNESKLCLTDDIMELKLRRI